jgi:hypothetical protein
MHLDAGHQAGEAPVRIGDGARTDHPHHFPHMQQVQSMAQLDVYLLRCYLVVTSLCPRK